MSLDTLVERGRAEVIYEYIIRREVSFTDTWRPHCKISLLGARDTFAMSIKMETSVATSKRLFVSSRQSSPRVKPKTDKR